MKQVAAMISAEEKKPNEANKIGRAKTTLISKYMDRLNPNRWFNDLSSIEITLEELASKNAVPTKNSQ